MKIFNIMVNADTIPNARKLGIPYICVCIPWEMIQPHYAQAEKNHYQTLERLHERGGLSACEALAVLEDRGWSKMLDSVSNQALCKKVAEWVDQQLYPEPKETISEDLKQE